jgi:hypothetical protein
MAKVFLEMIRIIIKYIFTLFLSSPLYYELYIAIRYHSVIAIGSGAGTTRGSYIKLSSEPVIFLIFLTIYTLVSIVIIGWTIWMVLTDLGILLPNDGGD